MYHVVFSCMFTFHLNICLCTILYLDVFLCTFLYLDVCLCTNFGTYIGSLEATVPGVAGDLYAVDKTTIFISNMSFPTSGSGKPVFSNLGLR